MMPAVEFDSLSYSWGNGPLLTDFSLSVEPGEFVALIGPSGCGKSTLFGLLAGLLRPQAGAVRIDGRPVTKPGGVALMPQRDALLPWRTVRENGALLLELQGVKKGEALRRVEAMLPRCGLAGWGDAYPAELSGGMRQRAAFLRTILAGAPVLLLDEPFGALDALTRLQMQEWLVGIWEEERPTVLFITHDVEEALLLADRVVLMGPRGSGRYQVIAVDLPRPRDRALLGTAGFAAQKAALLRALFAPKGVGAG
jgi:putative hydroxymethylpyrimidine transport system ATP-binding protein